MLLSKAYEEIIRCQFKRIRKCTDQLEIAIEKGKRYDTDYWYDEMQQALHIVSGYEIALSEIKSGEYPDHEI